MTDGEKLRELRKEKGYTQKALAISLGVSQMSISIAENKDHRAQEFLIALEGLEGLGPLKNESQKRSHGPRVSTRYWLENGKLMSSRSEKKWAIKRLGTERRK
ncbi:helix-turn-helix transcriptional regulator [Faecalibaculum rodentium]|uniref:helix-turn-helix transcriptional regulator n=2 Tax=Faecalibaculum rodentium TaxID=1702221 RepID=UPI0023F57AF5|nr:helix-turn-helix transcriptional regulator [Faecalibaculum rodentium]